MKSMTKHFDKKTIIGALVAIIILLIIAILASSETSKAPETGNAPAAQAPEIPPPVTREPVPTNVSVPDTSSKNVPDNVAKPTLVAPASPTSDSSYRNFNIRIENNKFIPDTIIVKAWDTTNLNITAVDKGYDFTQPDYGFKAVSIPIGASKKIQFSASASGKFIFYCASCGGPSSGPVGYIIVSD